MAATEWTRVNGGPVKGLVMSGGDARQVTEQMPVYGGLLIRTIVATEDAEGRVSLSVSTAFAPT